MRRPVCRRGRSDPVAQVQLAHGGKMIELDLDTLGMNPVYGPARRTAVCLFFDGVDITADLRKYLLSVSYTDNADGETDDLQIRLQDRSELWSEKWLLQALNAASLPGSSSIRFTYETNKKVRAETKKQEDVRQSNFRMQAFIIRRNWNGEGKDEVLDCGEFFLDEITGTGAPNCVTLKGSSAPYRATLRQSPVSKHWSNIRLGDIAKYIAQKSGLQLMNLLEVDPWINVSDQNKESDSAYLARLCKKFNVNLKFTNTAIILYSGTAKTGGTPLEISKRDLKAYDFRVGKAQREYDYCTVTYITPKGTKYSGTAYVKDFDPERDENLHLELNLKCSNNAEARQLAAYQLERHNRYAVTGSVTLPGNQRIVGGVKVLLNDFGLWSGLWAVSSANHTVDGSGGYVTKAELRKIDE